MKNIITLTLIFSLFGCTKSKEAENPVVITKPVDTSKVGTIEQTESNYIINDSIVDILWGFPSVGANINTISVNSFTLEKKPKTNTHNPTVTDTIYTYLNNSGSLEIYKAADRYILSNFTMQDDFVFKNNLKIGSSKKEFSKLMKLKIPKRDTITIGDSEQNEFVEFIFRNDTLMKVNYQGYVD